MNKPFDKSFGDRTRPDEVSFAQGGVWFREHVSECAIRVFETKIWVPVVSSHESLNNIVEHTCSIHEILGRYALIYSVNGPLHFRV